MKLKELRLYGFKSFPYKTTLELSAGMTALVGPNGCGKSNVLDAIRWVLGEQTLSKLRCARSEDLVFAGSARLAEQGYAEVSLIVENEADFADLPAEVELKRRYYRTGDSSFWINREECRLKEIEEILRGGAAGGRLYSVFDSRKLAAIVGGDLANLMESAAGVLGFRERRRESERKLKLVHRDLVRLDDIISERQRIVRSLRRQRRRAELYKELRAEMVTLEARKLRSRLEHIETELAGRQETIADKESVERSLLVAVDTIRKFLTGKDTELTNLLEAQHAVRQVLDGITDKLTTVTSALSASRARIESLTENLARIGKEKTDTESRVSELDAELAGTGVSLGEVIERREEAEAKLRESRQDLAGDEEQLASRRAGVKDLRERVKELTVQLAGLSEERTRDQSRAENAEAMALAARSELTRLSANAEELRKETLEIEAGLETAVEKLAREEKRITVGEAKLKSLACSIDTDEGQRQEAIERRSRLAGQIASLEEKIERKPRRLLRDKLGAKVRGVLEEFLIYPRELEAALEAVLFDVLGFLASPDMPEVGVLELQGQAGLVLYRNIYNNQEPHPADPRFKQWLSEKVKLKDGAPPFLNARIASWVLVDSVDLSSASQDYPRLSFVTTDGTSIRADGVALVGRPQGVLADRRNLSELKSAEKETSRLIVSVEKSLSGLRTSRQKVYQDHEKAKTEYLESLSIQKSLQSELERAASRRAELERDRDRVRREANARAEEQGKAARNVTRLTTRIEGSSTERESAETQLSAAEKNLSDEEEKLRDKLSGLNDLLLALGREEETEKGLLERKDRLASELKRLADRLQSSEEEKTRTDAEIATLSAEVEELTAKQNELSKSRTAEETRLAEISTSALMETKRAKEAEFAAKQAELEELRSELINLRTDVVLLERERAELIPAATVPEDAEQPMTLAEVEARLAELNRRLADLGPVNEYAAIQYEEEKSELDRIKAQHTDVTRAAESLEAIISEIDEEARSRYERTFRALREEFRGTFNFFFPGGEADLGFEDPEDPFNSEIRITARPEGKQLKRLSQLSEGERTMLGISLLFAFYAVRPAPFLFVDELDAPLDDNNVLKFASFLSRIKDRIQAFVITHNKRTMEKADTIYGVTMEEPGVSKIISVRLKEVKRRHVAVEET